MPKSNGTDHRHHPPDNNMAVLQGLTATLAQLAKAKTQMVMLASLKEDIILRADSDKGEESEGDKSDTVDINSVVNDMLDSAICIQTLGRTRQRKLPHALTQGRRMISLIGVCALDGEISCHSREDYRLDR